jgi:hypothetical protein
VGTTAAVQLGMLEDFGLLVAAVFGTWIGLTHGHGRAIGRTRVNA